MACRTASCKSQANRHTRSFLLSPKDERSRPAHRSPFGNLLCTAAFNLCGIAFVGTCADVVFRIPLLRCLTMLGVRSASKASITRELSNGVNVGLVPDGIAGIFATCASRERVAVAKRRGAARLALEQGVVVNPAFLLGT
jgi:hypothetical protein